MNTLDAKEFVEALVDAINRNTEKLSETLERIELIEGLIESTRDQRGIKEQSDAEFRENVLEWLRRIHQQGTP